MAIWFIMACSSLYLANDARNLEKTKLAIYAPDIPKGYNLQFATTGKPISITGTINDIAKSHNRNVELLEKSIHQSARTSFMINLLSFVLSLLGLFAQVGSFIHEKKKENTAIATKDSHPKKVSFPMENNSKDESKGTDDGPC